MRRATNTLDQPTEIHPSLKRHKTDSLQSSVCDIGIVQIPPAVNGWRATKVCGLSPSSLGAQMDPLLWPKHKVLKYKYNIPVTSWQCDWVFREDWALTLQCTFSYLGKKYNIFVLQYDLHLVTDLFVTIKYHFVGIMKRKFCSTNKVKSLMS